MFFFTNAHGLALLAAVETELVPKVEGGWDTEQFEKFWQLFGKKLSNSPYASKAFSEEIIGENTKNRTNHNHKQIVYTILPFLSFVYGFLLALFTKFG